MVRLREDGVALPITIFLVTVLTIMLVASFTRVQGEVQLAGGSTDMVSAFGVAQSGLHGYMGIPRTTRPADADSVRINVVGGYADVVAHLVRNDTLAGQWNYVIRSRGHVIVPAAGPAPQAVHTVAQFARWQWGDIATPSAWTSVGNVVKSSLVPVGTDVNVLSSGIDACGLEPTTTGIYAHAMPDTSEGISVFGSPPYVIDGSQADISSLTGIDWPAVLAGAIKIDSDTIFPNDTTFKTYLIDGETTPTNIRGSGLLIVPDRFRTTGNYFVWDGLVLVGGRVAARAADSTVIRGMLVSGLNWQTGGTLINSVVDLSPLSVYYDSCNIERSISSLQGLVPIQNGWLDHWAAY